ncbi:MAG: outer membrane beta-barrel protein, partial [Bacteroidota bacterium]
SPSIWGGTFETDAMGSLNIGVQKKVFDGRGNIRLAINDVFRTSNWTAISQLGALFQDGAGGHDSRQFRVNFSYLIGNEQVKKTRRRNKGLDAEAKRVN